MINNNPWFNNMNMNMDVMNNMNNMNMNMMNNNKNLTNQNNLKLAMNMNNNNNFGMINMPNNGMNMNMANFNKNFSNMNLLLNLYNKFKNQNNGFAIQLGIALGLNKNKPYNNYLKPPSFAFLTSSSNDTNFQEFGNPDVINIVFITMKGNKHSRKFLKNEKINVALKKFLISVGLNENALNKIQFLCNATNLNTLDKNMTLQQFNITNNTKINVIDRNNIIGAQ